MPEKPTRPPEEQDSERSFLRRWSDRKANAAAESEQQTASEAAEAGAPEPVETPEAEPAPVVTEADLENLTYESDYTKFMAKEVPDALRRRALRQLWRSDPVLANLDGLCDYDDDFTDAALAVKVLQTTHKIGQGYLSDDELAANRARGKTGPEAEDSDAGDIGEDDSEDIEATDDDETIDPPAAATEVASTDDDTPAVAGSVQSACDPKSTG